MSEYTAGKTYEIYEQAGWLKATYVGPLRGRWLFEMETTLDLARVALMGNIREIPVKPERKFKMGDTVRCLDWPKVWHNGTVVGPHPEDPNCTVIYNVQQGLSTARNECVELIPERHKIEGWVNVYENSQHSLRSTREEADAFQLPDRIACIYVSGTEGIEP